MATNHKVVWIGLTYHDGKPDEERLLNTWMSLPRLISEIRKDSNVNRIVVYQMVFNSDLFNPEVNHV